ncbi:hypothetical protein AB0407_37545 [Streptomyces microflavus]|uniref:hypothetical protein n=1 Tax=Streptomyces microflavus TaxID=1919 RepID=UPI0034500078
MSVGFRPTEDDAEIIEALKRPGEKTSDVLRRALRALERDEWQNQANRDMQDIAASGENLADEPDEWGHDETGNLIDRRAEETRFVDVVAEVAAELDLNLGDDEAKPAPHSRLGQRRLLAAALVASQRRNSSSPLYVGRAARHAADALVRRLEGPGRLEPGFDRPENWVLWMPKVGLPWGTRWRDHLNTSIRDLVWVAANQDSLTEHQEKILSELAESLKGDEAGSS